MTIVIPMWILYLIGAVVGVPLAVIIFALAYVGILALKSTIRW